MLIDRESHDVINYAMGISQILKNTHRPNDMNLLEVITYGHGLYIASVTGLHYDGYQESFVSRSGEFVGGYMQFTCQKSGDTIAARSLEEAGKKIETLRLRRCNDD